MRTSLKSRKYWFGRCFLSLVVSAGLASISLAQQFDAPYYDLEQRNRAKWADEDRDVQAKLVALEKKHRKKPNIIYLLPDDIGWGETGAYGGGEVRGAPTPNLDQMAREGIQFTSFYSEPSCTPTRVALFTGRHPVRTGLIQVLFPGAEAGLAEEEVTLAELMKKAGYNTAMFGKWHLGEHEEYHPTNHGFDEAYYVVYNESPAMYNKDGEKDHLVFDYTTAPDHWKTGPYKLQGVYEARAGQKPVEVKPFNQKTSQFLSQEYTQRTIDYIKKHAKDDKPFFLWGQQKGIFFGPPHPDFQGKSLQGNNVGDQMMEHDYRVGQILQAVKDAGIAENTLVIWSSDNGPMFSFFGEEGYAHFRGGKGQVLEGGVRVPAVAWWPGVIEPRKDNQMVHTADMYTTLATIAGVRDKIPEDRVVDGVDQTALLLNNGSTRRNYMFHYDAAKLGAVRLDHFKRHLGFVGSLPGKDFYNVYRDPQELRGTMAQYLWTWVPFDDLIEKHNKLIEKFPHRVVEY